MEDLKEEVLKNKTIAHELKQPLSAVVMLSESSMDNLDGQAEPDNGINTTLREIRDQAVLCHEIIERMSHPYDKEQVKFEMTDVNKLIQKTLDDLTSGNNYSKINIVVRRDLQDDLPEVNLDRVTIYEALMNLFTNAVDAMENSTKKILTVSSRKAEHGVNITVTDTGTGTRKGLNEKIFEPYFSTKDKDGEGIGLSVCKNILSAHDGTLKMNSEENVGTCFTIFLPGGN